MSHNASLAWRIKTFEAMTGAELYAVLQLRSAVFVVEQTCVFQDIDGEDPRALHVLAADGEQLLAYARCFAPGVKCAEASIGRVVTHGSQRGSGLGHALMARAIACIDDRWGPQPIRIGAQARLEAFYQQHGFSAAGPLYIEDAIEHLEMVRPAEV